MFETFGWLVTGLLAAAAVVGALFTVGKGGSAVIGWAKYWLGPKRPDHKAQLKKFYVEAGQLLDNFPNQLSMVGNYRQRCKQADDFVNRASEWIGTNMGPVSKSRFLDLGTEGRQGDAAEWKLKVRRQNLARMIEADSWSSAP